MRLAVLADIHGNLEALMQVMADIETRAVDRIISLGDNIGYGADSEAVVQYLRSHHIVSVLGNHEAAVIDTRVRGWFRGDALAAIQCAMGSLSESSVAYIRTLPFSLAAETCFFVHGFPPDSIRLYLFQVSDAVLSQTLDNLEETVCFVGHTHMTGLIYPVENGLQYEKSLQCGLRELSADCKHIINVGSVGQPRDGNPDARYVIWDTVTRMLEIRSVAYDAVSAARKIRAAGIPERYARCLANSC